MYAVKGFPEVDEIYHHWILPRPYRMVYAKYQPSQQNQVTKLVFISQKENLTKSQQ